MGAEKSAPFFIVSDERILLIKKKIHLHEYSLRLLLYLCRRINLGQNEKSNYHVHGLPVMDGSHGR